MENIENFKETFNKNEWALLLLTFMFSNDKIKIKRSAKMNKKDLQKAIKLQKQFDNVFSKLKDLSQKGLITYGGKIIFIHNKEQFMQLAKEVKAEVITKHYEATDWHNACDVTYFDYKGIQVINGSAGFSKG